MKAAIISLGSKSSEMLGEAMKKLFDDVEMIDLKKIEVRLGKQSGVFYLSQPFPQFDCVYVKGSFRYAHLLESIATLLEGKVPYMPLKASSFTLAHNKLLTHLALQEHHMPMPATYVSSTVAEAKEVLKRVRYPIVMKFPEGTQGKGVMFAESISSASSLLDALGALNQPFIIQEYVETEGADIRALVVGERVVAAMRRQAQKDEKRANIHAGGTGKAVQLSKESIHLAVDTARVLQADICGVDILEGPMGALVIEANVSPGLQGITEVTKVDVAGEMAKFMLQQTQKKVLESIQPAAKAAPELGVMQEILSELQFRGDKIILPEIVNKIAQFKERKDYIIKVGKGVVEVRES